MNDTNPYRFFITDDDPGTISVLTHVLESAGHTVESTTSSVEAAGIIKTMRPDCALIDIMMPQIDGLELCRELRKIFSSDELKIIIVSAKPYEFDRRRAMKFGADGFLTKPINAMTFEAQVIEIIQDRLELKFWGVRGTLPVPGPEALKYGGNTSCVTLDFPKEQFFIFDAGTGIKALSDSLLGAGKTRKDYKAFISHPHWDHINALPFFAPLYIPGNEIEVLGAGHDDVTMRELISAQMDDIYFPITIKEFGARTYFRNLNEGTFEVDKIQVKTLLLAHPGHCLGYRVEYGDRSVCYVTDNELFLPDSDSFDPFYVEKLSNFVRGTDALITDCTYTDAEYETKVGWGHSSIGQVVDLAHNADVKNLYLFHHDPGQTDDDIDRKHETAVEDLAKRNSSTQCLAPSEGDLVRI